MMVRTQIQFERDQYRFVKEQAKNRGVSISAYLRDLVARQGPGQPKKRDLSSVVGLFASNDGVTDVSKNVDSYIAKSLVDKET